MTDERPLPPSAQGRDIPTRPERRPPPVMALIIIGTAGFYAVLGALLLAARVVP